ncbi:MAG: hypothetical protein EFT35_08095 [Methanophagales archaeon ANME-1-THS]|nr:MAG: hypothetical protein EFT35_08095 [Methanophagales archaeon ANME-1-THS]
MATPIIGVTSVLAGVLTSKAILAAIGMYSSFPLYFALTLIRRASNEEQAQSLRRINLSVLKRQRVEYSWEAE